MELNKLAGRTFNDLMQYPVFPFILADYNSTELDLRRADIFRSVVNSNLGSENSRPIAKSDNGKYQQGY